mgnify:CR=1 FL=1
MKSMNNQLKTDIKRLVMAEYKRLKLNYWLKELNFAEFSVFHLPDIINSN